MRELSRRTTAMSVTGRIQLFCTPRRLGGQARDTMVSDLSLHRYIPETRSSKVATGVHLSHLAASSPARVSGPRRKQPHA